MIMSVIVIMVVLNESGVMFQYTNWDHVSCFIYYTEVGVIFYHIS